MSDILSATSLILTIITVLYGLWYEEINNAINIKSASHKDDNKQAIEQVEKTLIYKAIPLFIACLMLTCIMIVEVIPIIYDSVVFTVKYKFSCFRYYDSVKMIYFIVFLFSLAILVYTFTAAWCLCKKKKQLGK
jgi:hypothetical protein